MSKSEKRPGPTARHCSGATECTGMAATPSRPRRARDHGGHSYVAVVAGVAAAVIACGALGGCGVIDAVTKAVNTMETNRAIIKAFSKNLKSSEKSTFQATYVTTGTSPVTVIYAVQPPKQIAFEEMPTSGGPSDSGSYDLVANGSGAYSCSPASGSTGTGPGWSCTKLAGTKSVVQSGIVDLYTPAHWVGFLAGIAVVAGLAGDVVTSSHKVVNGFNMSCVNLVIKGVTGKSTICTTSEGVLGYVNVAGDSTSFEIKAYSSAPAASMFQLPVGAKLTTPRAAARPRSAPAHQSARVPGPGAATSAGGAFRRLKLRAELTERGVRPHCAPFLWTPAYTPGAGRPGRAQTGCKWGQLGAKKGNGCKYRPSRAKSRPLSNFAPGSLHLDHRAPPARHPAAGAGPRRAPAPPAGPPPPAPLGGAGVPRGGSLRLTTVRK